MLGNTEDDGAIEGEGLVLGSVVGFDEGVCVAQSWMLKAYNSVDVVTSSCRSDKA